MPTQLKISAKDFYESLPSGTHSTGDIWAKLPTFGLLNESVASIVITPACDLAQKKCEAITYLPILPIADYLSSSAFYLETWQAIQDVLAKLKLSHLVIPPNRFELPIQSEIESAIASISHGKKDEGTKNQLLRVKDYSSFIQSISSGRKPSVAQIEKIVTKPKFEKILSALITNAYKPDIHFLPADGQPVAYSAIPTNSVILFRNPLTIPISVLDAAQFCVADQWNEVRTRLTITTKTAHHLTEWPVKLARLRDDFLSDMLSRYLAMYIRLGSRDFTEEDVGQFVGKIRNLK